jgi:hypothetical protein
LLTFQEQIRDELGVAVEPDYDELLRALVPAFSGEPFEPLY